MSPERLKELQDEMNYLKTVREKEVAELIKEARSFGDLSENSEYDEAKNEQGKLYSRMAELDEILSNYVVIEEEQQDGDYVRLGTTVTVLDKEFNEEETYKICLLYTSPFPLPRSPPASMPRVRLCSRPFPTMCGLPSC